jgi:hypothetical protein
MILQELIERDKMKEMKKIKTIKTRGIIILVIFVVGLFTFSAIPVISSGNVPSSIRTTSSFATQSLANSDNLSENIKIQCYGIYPIDVPLAILRLPVFYVRIQIDNNNDVALNVDQHLKLTTRAGRVLDEFDDNISFPLIPHSLVSTQYWIRAMWKYFHYLFGFFDLTLDFSLRDYDYQTTLLFHGLVFGCGAVIFNPNGDKI